MTGVQTCALPIYAVHRIEIDHLKVIFYHIGTETVNCADEGDPQVHEQQSEGNALGVAAPLTDGEGDDAQAQQLGTYQGL